MSFTILGTGSALPATIITNDDLSQVVDTSDAWIRSRTGIAERRICKDETISDLAYQAAMAALADGNCEPKELDMIICATMTPDYITPSLACVLQMRLGATCPAFDINAACTGLLYAMDIAAAYYTRNPQMKILLVGADAMSKLVNWQDRGTCVLFGDGAGAILLGPGNDLLDIQIGGKGNIDALYAPGLPGNCPFREDATEQPYLVMDGKEVFRFAVLAMTNTVEAALAHAGIRKEELTYILPHQANIRIIDAAISRLKIPPEKCLSNISTRGNTSAACVAILLDESNRAGKLKKGDLLALTAFGGGLTTGACILRWSKETI